MRNLSARNKALNSPSLRVAVSRQQLNFFQSHLFWAIFCLLQIHWTAILLVRHKPTLFFHSKVDDGSLGGDLGRVMRITQFRCNIETELRTVLHFLVTKPNQPTTTCQRNTTTLQFIFKRKYSNQYLICSLAGARLSNG